MCSARDAGCSKKGRLPSAGRTPRGLSSDWTSSITQAFSLLTSSTARRFFDLDEEPETLRTRYGGFRFGQCCLMARRLVEAGVPFVQVNWSSHVEPIEDAVTAAGTRTTATIRSCRTAIAGCWIKPHSAAGRLARAGPAGAHRRDGDRRIRPARRRSITKRAATNWEQCYSALVAGGGLRCGQVIGSSDALAQYPASRKLCIRVTWAMTL